MQRKTGLQAYVILIMTEYPAQPLTERGLRTMLAEVEKGSIGTIIVKDMSRLGRNYVQMGMLREQLRRANVRLMAVNEGVDTGSGLDDDFLPLCMRLH